MVWHIYFRHCQSSEWLNGSVDGTTRPSSEKFQTFRSLSFLGLYILDIFTLDIANRASGLMAQLMVPLDHHRKCSKLFEAWVFLGFIFCLFYNCRPKCFLKFFLLDEIELEFDRYQIYDHQNWLMSLTVLKTEYYNNSWVRYLYTYVRRNSVPNSATFGLRSVQEEVFRSLWYSASGHSRISSWRLRSR